MGEEMQPLYLLQLSEMRRRAALRLHCADCIVGGILGALAAIAVIWWLR